MLLLLLNIASVVHRDVRKGTQFVILLCAIFGRKFTFTCVSEQFLNFGLTKSLGRCFVVRRGESQTPDCCLAFLVKVTMGQNVTTRHISKNYFPKVPSFSTCSSSMSFTQRRPSYKICS